MNLASETKNLGRREKPAPWVLGVLETDARRERDNVCTVVKQNYADNRRRQERCKIELH